MFHSILKKSCLYLSGFCLSFTFGHTQQMSYSPSSSYSSQNPYQERALPRQPYASNREGIAQLELDSQEELRNNPRAMRDWTYRQNWRYHKNAFYHGDNEISYSPYPAGGVGYESDERYLRALYAYLHQVFSSPNGEMANQNDLVYLDMQGDAIRDQNMQRKDASYRQNWRYHRNAFYQGETDPQDFQHTHPDGPGGIGYDADENYLRMQHYRRQQQATSYRQTRPTPTQNSIPQNRQPIYPTYTSPPNQYYYQSY